MKSKNQTYAIQDNEDYNGVFEFQFMIDQMMIQKDGKIEENMALTIGKLLGPTKKNARKPITL